MNIDFTLHQARQLADLWGGDEEPGTLITVAHCESGHSGPGLYAWFEEYPEEGSVKLNEQPTLAEQEPAMADTTHIAAPPQPPEGLERDLFEAWAVGQGYDVATARPPYDYYLRGSTTEAWFVWREARARSASSPAPQSEPDPRAPWRSSWPEVQKQTIRPFLAWEAWNDPRKLPMLRWAIEPIGGRRQRPLRAA
jgi:hypothetical protein